MKAYTNIEQSKKLANILPLESADMRIGNYVGESGKVDGTNIHYYVLGESFGAPEIICAWSLAALLKLMPKIGAHEPMLRKLYYISEPTERYICQYSLTDMTSEYDNPIDACFEMIIHLHELKML